MWLKGSILLMVAVSQFIFLSPASAGRLKKDLKLIKNAFQCENVFDNEVALQVIESLTFQPQEVQSRFSEFPSFLFEPESDLERGYLADMGEFLEGPDEPDETLQAIVSVAISKLKKLREIQLERVRKGILINGAYYKISDYLGSSVRIRPEFSHFIYFSPHEMARVLVSHPKNCDFSAHSKKEGSLLIRCVSEAQEGSFVLRRATW